MLTTMKLTSMGTTFLNDLNVGLWQLKLQQKQHRTMSCKHLLLFVIILWLPYHFMKWERVNLCKFPTFHEGDLRPDIVTRKDCLKAGEADFPPKRHTPEWWWWRWRRWWFHSLDNLVAVFFFSFSFDERQEKKHQEFGMPGLVGDTCQQWSFSILFWSLCRHDLIFFGKRPLGPECWDAKLDHFCLNLQLDFHGRRWMDQ